MKTGTFSGPVETRWNCDGRTERVMKDLVYTDADGVEWIAPAGSVVDGASIPRFAWWIVGSPFVGKYRRASVIHDVYCESKERPWRNVHQVFYEMMAADGVGAVKRWLMFRAVWMFGPRWSMIKVLNLKKGVKHGLDH